MVGTSYRPLVERYQRINKPSVNSGYCTLKRLVVFSALICMCFFFAMQLLLYFRHLFSDMHLMQDSDGELVVISSRIAMVFNAFCLDGSTPGYYHRKGLDDGERKWLIAFPHSDWCIDKPSCLALAKSQADQDRRLTIQFSGVLSPDLNQNPEFFNWNMVQLQACDGASLLGNSSWTLGSDFLQSRGSSIIQAVLSHLKLVNNMEMVNQIVVYGRNGGALTAALYTPFIRLEFPWVTEVSTILHDGVLLHDSLQNSDLWSWFNVHSVKDNRLIDCPAPSCLTLPALRSARPLTLLTARAPDWPVAVTYGCQEVSCHRLGSSKLYEEKLMDKLLDVKSNIIVTSCPEELEISPLPLSNSRQVYNSVINSLTASGRTRRISDHVDCSKLSHPRKIPDG